VQLHIGPGQGAGAVDTGDDVIDMKTMSGPRSKNAIVGAVLGHDGSYLQRSGSGFFDEAGNFDPLRFAECQPETILLRLGHTGECVGEIAYLERLSAAAR
jgi:hypothetical protein